MSQVGDRCFCGGREVSGSVEFLTLSLNGVDGVSLCTTLKRQLKQPSKMAARRQIQMLHLDGDAALSVLNLEICNYLTLVFWILLWILNTSPQ